MESLGEHLERRGVVEPRQLGLLHHVVGNGTRNGPSASLRSDGVATVGGSGSERSASARVCFLARSKASIAREVFAPAPVDLAWREPGAVEQHLDRQHALRGCSAHGAVAAVGSALPTDRGDNRPWWRHAARNPGSCGFECKRRARGRAVRTFAIGPRAANGALRPVRVYSARKVTIGSTRVARYAGISVATMPTSSTRPETMVKVPGSYGLTP